MARPSKPMEHRAGWDATFSAPKSVSLTALVGGDDRVREAHRESVGVALEQLERYTQAASAATIRPRLRASLSPPSLSMIPRARSTAMSRRSFTRMWWSSTSPNATTASHARIQPQSLFASQQFATAVYQSELTYRAPPTRLRDHSRAQRRSGDQGLYTGIPRRIQSREANRFVNTSNAQAAPARKPPKSQHTRLATARRFIHPQR